MWASNLSSSCCKYLLRTSCFLWCLLWVCSLLLWVFFWFQTVAHPQIVLHDQSCPLLSVVASWSSSVPHSNSLDGSKKGFSVLIRIGSNLKLIFQSKYFVVFFYIGTVVPGQAESPSKSIIFSLRRAGSRYIGKECKTQASTERSLSWYTLLSCWSLGSTSSKR